MATAADTGRAAAWGILVLTSAMLAGQAGASALRDRPIPVGEFDRVFFTGAGTVHLTQGPASRLTLRGHVSLLDAVAVETRGGALHILTPDSAGALVVELTVASLAAFTSKGEGRIVGEDLHFDALTLAGSGAGSFDLQRLQVTDLEVHGRGATRFDFTGQVHNHVVHLSGTGAYQAVELISDCVSIQAKGALDVRLWAEQELDVEVAGAARIRYAGSPRLEQRVSGIAQVQRLARIAI